MLRQESLDFFSDLVNLVTCNWCKPIPKGTCSLAENQLAKNKKNMRFRTLCAARTRLPPKGASARLTENADWEEPLANQNDPSAS